ncbi:MAG: DNA/RNA non-specific endonuclease [Nibricoccus sp.]
MIIVDEREGQVRAEAFLFSQDTPEADSLERHLVSIDDIEARTGLDFLSELPDEAETALESRSAVRVW